LKRYGNLYSKVYDFENIYKGYLKARKDKRYREEILEFTENLEENLINIQNELIWKTYRPRPVRQFYVYEPKKRLITAPAFYDRVVHHALCNIIEPIFDKSFIYHSYACRKIKGTHKAVDKFQQYMRKAQGKWGRVYCLKIDIKRYFPSINHDILFKIIKRKIKDPDILWLIKTIIDSNPGNTGIGIGALTSQLFANIYLNQLDHFVKEVLRMKYYVRYMDDIVILGRDKKQLRQVLNEIKDFLWDRFKLETNSKTQIMPINRGITYLGYRVWPTHRLLKGESKRRIKKKLRLYQKLYREGKVDLDEIRASVMSWLGHLKHCNSYNLKRKLLNDFVLTKGDIMQ
jgi:retron-type reverse transcriptase